MQENQKNTLEEVAKDWLAARDVLTEALCELYPGPRRKVHEQNAAFLIARLAAHKPPILLEVDRGQHGSS